MAERRDKTGLRSEILMGFGVIGMVFVLIIPLPPMLLDIMIAVNIAFATLVLLITLGAKEALELSTYPTLLLLTTLFRLALNVASTRLILLKGQAGDVIQAFGDFVVGGDLVVGIVIFVILILIQFIVITKGSNRISEVAARFTLDAMPGKQMAIDADLNAGLITENDARERREKISQEAEFYGAMDGAGKFVRGDAIAGLIINIINIVGGVVIGMTNDLAVGAALEKYSILTIGDGLVSQTPALIIAISAGMLVTKTSSKQRFATEFGMQMFANRRALGIGAAAIGILALVPGFPKLPFMTLAIGMFLAQRAAARAEAAEIDAEEKESQALLTGREEEEDGPELTPETLGRLLQVDRMGIEIGYRLIGMVERKGGLLDHITKIRKQFARDQGLIVPPIRLKDNLSLEANEYRILIAGQEVARGALYPDHFMAMNPGTVTEEIDGIKGADPTFALPAVWVREDRKTEAEMLGYTVVDVVSVLVTHLTETIRRHAHEIITREDVQTLVDRVKEAAPTVVGELIPDVLGLGDVQRVLQNLLSERVPIRNLPLILEALADNGRQLKDPDQLTELVRQRLTRVLSERHVDSAGRLHAIVVDPQLESAIEAELQGGGLATVSASAIQQIQQSALDRYGEAAKTGADAVLLARGTVRRYFADVLKGMQPQIAVLSYSEVTGVTEVIPVGQVSITTAGRTAEPQAAGVPG